MGLQQAAVQRVKPALCNQRNAQKPANNVTCFMNCVKHYTTKPPTFVRVIKLKCKGDIWIWFQGWGLWVLLAISLAVALYYKKEKHEPYHCTNV